MKLVIHVGYPKTGSTTLQYGLFKYLHDVGQIHLKMWRQNISDEPLTDRLSSLLFQKNPISDKYKQLRQDKLNFISDESLTAPIRLRQNDFGDEIENPNKFPSILKTTFTTEFGYDLDIKILVVLRNQAELLYSQYVEEYKLILYKSIDLLHNKRGELDLTGMDIYDYSTYLETLQKSFGKENIVVCLFEDWKHDPSTFFTQISSIVSVDINHVADILTRTHKNKKIKTSAGYVTEVSNIQVDYFSDEMKSLIMDRFKKSNGVLASNWNISKEKLNSYGYI